MPYVFLRGQNSAQSVPRDTTHSARELGQWDFRRKEFPSIWGLVLGPSSYASMEVPMSEVPQIANRLFFLGHSWNDNRIARFEIDVLIWVVPFEDFAIIKRKFNLFAISHPQYVNLPDVGERCESARA